MMRQHVSNVLGMINQRQSLTIHPTFSSQDNSNAVKKSKSFLYEKIMEARKLLIDTRQCISSKCCTVDGKKLWLRSITNSNDIILSSDKKMGMHDNHAKDFLFNYLRLLYAHFSAALTICDIYVPIKMPSLIEYIYEMQSKAFDEFIEIISEKNISINECEKKILTFLQSKKGSLLDLLDQHLMDDQVKLDLTREGMGKRRKEILNKMLNQAKDWIGLEEPALPIYTLIDTKEFGLDFQNKKIAIVDEPCTNLTAEQIELINDRENLIWYLELNAFQKKMVDYYAECIKKGTRIIPSQLRSIIPLGKNSFWQAIYIENEEGEFTLHSECYHTGTAAYLSHRNQEVAKEITALNLKQQKMNSAADASVMIALNSTLSDVVIGTYQRILRQPYVADDRNIVQLTEKAAREFSPDENIFCSKLCLNLFRNFEFNNYNGINAIIGIIEANILHLKTWQDTDANLNQMIQDIEGLISEIRHLSDIKLWNDTIIKGTDIIYYLTRAATINNRIVDIYSDGSLKQVAIWIGCASGENRTGLAYYNNIKQTIIDYYAENGVNITDDFKQKIARMVAASNHIHILTGAGGTVGTEGIRKKSAGTAKQDDPIDMLVTKTADMKSIQPQDENFNNALENLRKTIKVKSVDDDSVAHKMLPYAINLYKYAKSKQDQLYLMPGLKREDRQDFTNALIAATNVLDKCSPENVNFLMQTTKKIDPTNGVKRHPIFHDRTKRSPGFTVFSCLLGIASIAVAAASIAAIVISCGFATVPAALGFTLAGTLATKAVAASAAVASTTAFTISSCFYRSSRKEDRNVTKNLYELNRIAAPNTIFSKN